jgi:hypothetical protein
MKTRPKRGALRNLSRNALKLLALAMPIYASAQTAGATQTPEVNDVVSMFTQGHFSGDVRAFYYGAHNAFYNKGLNQNTVNYGGGLEYETATLYGFSLGVSGYASRPLFHPSNPSRVDGSLGPSFTTLGEAYLKYQHQLFSVTAGNQEFDVPFISPYDYRIAPQLFQGVSATYGTKDNYIQAFRMFRWKSWISDSFTNQTTYNVSFDSASKIGNQGTSGFYGAGGAGTLAFGPLNLKGQAWYVDYMSYAQMGYADAQISESEGSFKPYAGAQVAIENGNASGLLGSVHSQVYGLQLGVKHNSIDANLNYDYIRPNRNSYLNGALVTPYAHNIASGPLFAQPFITSTQDLGAGSAYAFEISGSPIHNLKVGAGYSFMRLVSQPGTPYLDQSEYLAYAMYDFSGRLKGWNVTDFFAYQSSPARSSKFFQNRLQIQYAWGQ